MLTIFHRTEKTGEIILGSQVSHPLYLSKPLNGKGQNKFGSFTALALIEIKGAKLEYKI